MVQAMPPNMDAMLADPTPAAMAAAASAPMATPLATRQWRSGR